MAHDIVLLSTDDVFKVGQKKDGTIEIMLPVNMFPDQKKSEKGTNSGVKILSNPTTVEAPPTPIVSETKKEFTEPSILIEVPKFESSIDLQSVEPKVQNKNIASQNETVENPGLIEAISLVEPLGVSKEPSGLIDISNGEMAKPESIHLHENNSKPEPMPGVEFTNSVSMLEIEKTSQVEHKSENLHEQIKISDEEQILPTISRTKEEINESTYLFSNTPKPEPIEPFKVEAVSEPEPLPVELPKVEPIPVVPSFDLSKIISNQKPVAHTEVQTQKDQDVDILKNYLTLREKDISILKAQMDHKKDELDVANKKIVDLVTENEHLYTEIKNIKERMMAVEKERMEIERKISTDIDTVHREIDVKNEKIRTLEEKVRQAEFDSEKMKERVRMDLRKIRSREKELENRLEILKKDSEILIASRESKILELKRKVDLLEFNHDVLIDKNEQEKRKYEVLLEKEAQVNELLRKAFDTLTSVVPIKNIVKNENESVNPQNENTSAKLISIQKPAGGFTLPEESTGTGTMLKAIENDDKEMTMVRSVEQSTPDSDMTMVKPLAPSSPFSDEGSIQIQIPSSEENAKTIDASSSDFEIKIA